MRLTKGFRMGKVTQEQADKYNMSLNDLQKLAEGKDCSVYPGSVLHVRKTRGGVTVFNISDQARGESISATKQSRKVSKGGTRSTESIAAKSN